MPPKKKVTKPPKGPRGMGKPIPSGLVMEDLVKKKWQLGPVIGQGGFGYIYLGGQSTTGPITEANGNYVIKVEPHANGPLFVELAFYQRVAKPEMISSWLKEKRRKHVGIPLYIATGSFEHSGMKYRFMVMDRFGTDVEKIYKANDLHFPEETVYSLGLRVLDALEYIHVKEYCHADIKSSNIMLGFSKASEKKAYLLDYGLAYRYAPAGKHVAYKEDPKRRHDGTVEYTSRDAHKGCAPARRGDLEILGYCMLQWLCKKLPWEKNLEDKEYVMKEKIKYMNNIGSLMKECFPSGEIPGHLKDFLQYVSTLEYVEEPDYERIRGLFKAGLKKAGYNDDGTSIVLPSSRTATKKRVSAESSTPRSPRKRVRKDEQLPPSSPAKNGEMTSPNRPGGVKSSKSRAAPRKSPVKRTVRSPVKKSPEKRKVEKAASPRSKINSGGSASISAPVAHRRTRRKNVPTRDFAQSP